MKDTTPERESPEPSVPPRQAKRRLESRSDKALFALGLGVMIFLTAKAIGLEEMKDRKMFGGGLVWCLALPTVFMVLFFERGKALMQWFFSSSSKSDADKHSKDEAE